MALLRARSRYRLDPATSALFACTAADPLSRQTGIVDPKTSTSGKPATPNSSSNRDPHDWADRNPRPGNRSAGQRLAAGSRRRMVGLGLADNRADRQRILDEAAAAGTRPARVAGRLLAGGDARPRHPRVHRCAAAILSQPCDPASHGGPASPSARPGRAGRAAHSRIGGGWRSAPASPTIGCSSSTWIISPTPAAKRLTGCSDTAAEDVRAPIDRAFALILEHAAEWSGAPGMAKQAELHAPSPTLRRRPTGLAGHAAGASQRRMPQLSELRESSRRMIDLLPRGCVTRVGCRGRRRGRARLRRGGNPGCACRDRRSPAWAGVGAALSAIIGPGGRSGLRRMSPST